MEKIIFGITSLTLGGAERVLIDTANKLVDKYDITIFTIYSNGDLENELNDKIHLNSLCSKKYTDLSKMQKKIMPLKVLFNKKMIYKKYIDNEKYLAQISFLEGPITRIFSCKSDNKAKKIAWIHNDISKVFGKSIKSKLKRILDRNAYEKYNTLVFVSIDNMNKFNKVYDDIQLPHVKVINNYIDSNRILKLSDEKLTKDIFNSDTVNILQISRLVEQKAIDRLINVHSKLIKEGYNHHIFVIGTGPLKEKLEKQIDDLGIQNTFTLLGAKKNPYPYIKSADAFCLFSYFEGYGMVVDEAKILKKFIAITNTAAREALLDYPENSIIVENNEKGIEQAIKHIIKNKNEIIKKDDRYIYANDKIIDKIIKVIEK